MADQQGPMQERGGRSQGLEHVWLNDELVPLAEARISVLDRGFLYGDGFFETIRVEGGRILFLPEHLRRLARSAQEFRITWPAGVRWEARVARLLAVNGLEEGTAAVKVVISRGEHGQLGLPESSSPTVVIYARTYTPPSREEYARGWPVVVFPEQRSTFLGRHKSLNYLFYLAARQYALDHGAQEALVLESDGLVSEGAATSLVYREGGRFVSPAAKSALPSVTLEVLSRALARHGEKLDYLPTTLSRLHGAEGIWLANSLVGFMPVSVLNGTRVAMFPEGTAFLQECLAEEQQ